MIRATRLLAAYLLALSACTFDPTESDAVAALGGEAAGVRRGPLHRPGQPCLLCHDGDIGDPPAFSVAGTVFNDPVHLAGENQALVSLTDAVGNMYPATTNAAGNFYITPAQWSPVFPLSVVTVKPLGGVIVTMQSEVGRNGACASCHVSPAGSMSPGPVCATLADGGVPP